MRYQLDETSARQLGDVGTEGLYLVENSSLEQMLFNRNVVGDDFSQLCLEASSRFIAHLADELETCPDASELMILSKGIAYRIGDACSAVLGWRPPLNMIATRRASIGDDDAVIETMYERLDAGGSTLLIGDTVASGATIVAALRAYIRRWPLTTVYVVSFAGAKVGAERIADYCSKNDIRLTMLFGLAAFGLAPNGFDLSFLDPETVCQAAYRQRASEQFDGQPASAVGWDFGSQVVAPTKYRQLCWMEAEKWGLHGHPAFALEEEPCDMSLLAGESPAFE